jgi:hypothetical protein
MLLIRPTPGADDDVWDDSINTLVALIDSHRHVVGEGRQIPSAALDINADVQFNFNRASELSGAAFDNVGALPITGAREVFVFGGNLFYRNNSGTNVRITNGSTLDQTTVGGIAGDYSAVGAEVAFNDTTDTYTAKQQLGAGVRQYGKFAHADLQLFEYIAHPTGVVPANAVTIKSPAALAAPYTLTMPAALPGSQLLTQITAAGAVTLSNTVPSAVLMGGTLGVTGLVTATAGLTAAVNQSVTVSGSGGHKHGDRDHVMHAQGFQVATRGNWTFNTQNITSTALDIAYAAPQLPSGSRVKSVSVVMGGNGTVDVTVTAFSLSNTGVSTNLGSTLFSNVVAGVATYTVDITDTVITTNSIIITISPNATASVLYTCAVTYDYP